MKLRFRGSSDDLVYVSDGERTEEYHPNSDPNGDESMMAFAVANLYVFVFYDGVWHFSTRVQEEGMEIPEEVEIRIEQAHSYSMKLVIESEETELNEVPVDMDNVSF